MEVIGTPDFNYLDGWVSNFGNIVYIWFTSCMTLFKLVPYSKETKKEALSDMKRKLLPFSVALWCSRGKTLNVSVGGLSLIH